MMRRACRLLAERGTGREQEGEGDGEREEEKGADGMRKEEEEEEEVKSSRGGVGVDEVIEKLGDVSLSKTKVGPWGNGNILEGYAVKVETAQQLSVIKEYKGHAGRGKVLVEADMGMWVQKKRRKRHGTQWQWEIERGHVFVVSAGEVARKQKEDRERDEEATNVKQEEAERREKVIPGYDVEGAEEKEQVDWYMVRPTSQLQEDLETVKISTSEVRKTAATDGYEFLDCALNSLSTRSDITRET